MADARLERKCERLSARLIDSLDALFPLEDAPSTSDDAIRAWFDSSLTALIGRVTAPLQAYLLDPSRFQSFSQTIFDELPLAPPPPPSWDPAEKAERKRQAKKKKKGKSESKVKVLCEAKADFASAKQRHLNFSQGDRIMLTIMGDRKWWYGYIVGDRKQRGWVPSNFVTVFEKRKKSRRRRKRVASSPPPPPADDVPPPPPPAAPNRRPPPPPSKADFVPPPPPPSSNLCANDSCNWAQVFCCDCEEYYCDSCDRILHQGRKRGKHRRIPAEVQEEQQRTEEDNDPRKRKALESCRTALDSDDLPTIIDIMTKVSTFVLALEDHSDTSQTLKRLLEAVERKKRKLQREQATVTSAEVPTSPALPPLPPLPVDDMSELGIDSANQEAAAGEWSCSACLAMNFEHSMTCQMCGANQALGFSDSEGSDSESEFQMRQARRSTIIMRQLPEGEGDDDDEGDDDVFDANMDNPDEIDQLDDDEVAILAAARIKAIRQREEEESSMDLPEGGFLEFRGSDGTCIDVPLVPGSIADSISIHGSKNASRIGSRMGSGVFKPLSTRASASFPSPKSSSLGTPSHRSPLGTPRRTPIGTPRRIRVLPALLAVHFGEPDDEGAEDSDVMPPPDGLPVNGYEAPYGGRLRAGLALVPKPLTFDDHFMMPPPSPGLPDTPPSPLRLRIDSAQHDRPAIPPTPSPRGFESEDEVPLPPPSSDDLDVSSQTLPPPSPEPSLTPIRLSDSFHDNVSVSKSLPVDFDPQEYHRTEREDDGDDEADGDAKAENTESVKETATVVFVEDDNEDEDLPADPVAEQAETKSDATESMNEWECAKCREPKLPDMPCSTCGFDRSRADATGAHAHWQCPVCPTLTPSGVFKCPFCGLERDVLTKKRRTAAAGILDVRANDEKAKAKRIKRAAARKEELRRMLEEEQEASEEEKAILQEIRLRAKEAAAAEEEEERLIEREIHLRAAEAAIWEGEDDEIEDEAIAAISNKGFTFFTAKVLYQGSVTYLARGVKDKKKSRSGNTWMPVYAVITNDNRLTIFRRRSDMNDYSLALESFNVLGANVLRCGTTIHFYGEEKHFNTYITFVHCHSNEKNFLYLECDTTIERTSWVGGLAKAGATDAGWTHDKCFTDDSFEGFLRYPLEEGKGIDTVWGFCYVAVCGQFIYFFKTKKRAMKKSKKYLAKVEIKSSLQGGTVPFKRSGQLWGFQLKHRGQKEGLMFLAKDENDRKRWLMEIKNRRILVKSGAYAGDDPIHRDRDMSKRINPDLMKTNKFAASFPPVPVSSLATSEPDRLKELGKAGLSELINLALTPVDGSAAWLEFDSQQSVTLYMQKKPSHSSVQPLMGIGIVPLAPAELFKRLNDPSSRHSYDDWVKEAGTVCQLSAYSDDVNHKVVYLHLQSSKCRLKEGRDFCMMMTGGLLKRAELRHGEDKDIDFFSVLREGPGNERFEIIPLENSAKVGQDNAVTTVNEASSGEMDFFSALRQGPDLKEQLMEAERQRYVVCLQSTVCTKKNLAPLCPNRANVTRGKAYPSGWVIEEYKAHPTAELHSKVYYVTQFDYGGLPKNIVNLISSREPVMIASVRDMVLGRGLVRQMLSGIKTANRTAKSLNRTAKSLFKNSGQPRSKKEKEGGENDSNAARPKAKSLFKRYSTLPTLNRHHSAERKTASKHSKTSKPEKGVSWGVPEKGEKAVSWAMPSFSRRARKSSGSPKKHRQSSSKSSISSNEEHFRRESDILGRGSEREADLLGRGSGLLGRDRATTSRPVLHRTKSAY